MAVARHQAQAPGFHRMVLGDFVITALSDGTVFGVDSKLTGIDRARVDQLLTEACVPRPVETSINAFLIHTGTRLVLVDTGAGQLMGPSAGRLLPNLRAAGYEPEQIDTVLLTHIHTDHSGGLSAAGTRVFPNAVVRVDRLDADFWLSTAQQAQAGDEQKKRFQWARDALEPYLAAGRFQPFEGDAELLPGLRAQAARGHTPGHSFYAVESQGQKLVIWGDLVHVEAVQLAEPSATIEFDRDPRAAAARRAKAFAEAASKGYWVAGEHLSFPGIGHLRAQGEGYRWWPLPYSLGA
jgi:glyoxylase-like metal-dependent hydrolase (beta-lactamase superfamily II)